MAPCVVGLVSVNRAWSVSLPSSSALHVAPLALSGVIDSVGPVDGLSSSAAAPWTSGLMKTRGWAAEVNRGSTVMGYRAPASRTRDAEASAVQLQVRGEGTAAGVDRAQPAVLQQRSAGERPQDEPVAGQQGDVRAGQLVDERQRSGGASRPVGRSRRSPCSSPSGPFAYHSLQVSSVGVRRRDWRAVAQDGRRSRGAAGRRARRRRARTRPGREGTVTSAPDGVNAAVRCCAALTVVAPPGARDAQKRVS